LGCITILTHPPSTEGFDWKSSQRGARIRGVGATDGVDGPNGIDVPHCGSLKPATGEPPTMSISMIGLDTSKNLFVGSTSQLVRYRLQPLAEL
jgi:hypothetical protein